MNKTMVVVVTLAVIGMAATGYITYVVENHFDYVRTLENEVTELGGDIQALTEENIGLQSALVEPPSK